MTMTMTFCSLPSSRACLRQAVSMTRFVPLDARGHLTAVPR